MGVGLAGQTTMWSEQVCVHVQTVHACCTWPQRMDYNLHALGEAVEVIAMDEREDVKWGLLSLSGEVSVGPRDTAAAFLDWNSSFPSDSA